MVPSVQLPLVTNTRSFSVRTIPFSTPLTLHSMAFATFFPSSFSKITLSTSVLNRKSTPAASRYFCMGRIRDSYWLYFVNFRALKSGSPAMWCMKRWKYSFISRALCQFSKANMVLQYSQKVESNTSSSKTSSMVLSYRSSSLVMNSFMISMQPFWLKLNFPSVWASFPRCSVARQRE